MKINSSELKESCTYIIEIPYHRLTIKEDMEEMGNGLCHLMEKADLLSGEIPELRDEFVTLYEGIAEMFYLAEELEFRILKNKKWSVRNGRKKELDKKSDGK